MPPLLGFPVHITQDPPIGSVDNRQSWGAGPVALVVLCVQQKLLFSVYGWSPVHERCPSAISEGLQGLLPPLAHICMTHAGAMALRQPRSTAGRAPEAAEGAEHTARDRQ